MENLIKTEELFFEFQNEEDGSVYPVLKGIDLEIGKGEFVAVLGHNGSGKSTLAKHFNAILLPTKGKVFVEGIDTIDEGRLFDIRQKVGMVFQNPDNQIVATIVEEDVAFALENMGVEPNEIRRRVDEALKQVDMYEYRERAPHQLSGGQKQRIAIARIFLKNPPILILDEATSALDSVTEAKIQRAFDNLSRGRTTLIIAHRLSTIRSANRIISIADGRITESGTHGELLQKGGVYADLYNTQNALALEALKQ